MTSIPYTIEPVPVGTDKHQEVKLSGSKQNDKGAFPHDGLHYNIECRLRIDKYTRAEAFARCEELGNRHEGMFMSGGFYVFVTYGMAS